MRAAFAVWHFRSRSARPLVPSRNTAKAPTKLNNQSDETTPRQDIRYQSESIIAKNDFDLEVAKASARVVTRSEVVEEPKSPEKEPEKQSAVDAKYGAKASVRGQFVDYPETIKRTPIPVHFVIPRDIDKYADFLLMTGGLDPTVELIASESNFFNGENFLFITYNKIEYQII